MVVKGQPGLQKKPASATGEQVRLAQLTLEGKSTEDDTANIQKLIKKVIETTRCSPAQAELALYDNDNNLVAAVDYIFEQGMQVESWTEQKSKKDKKKEDEEKRITSSRGLPASRGRGGGVADRGGRGGRGGSAAPRSTFPRGGGVPGRGGRGGQSIVKPQRSQTEAPQKPAESDLTEEVSDWKSGPMEFKRSEVITAIPSSSSECAQTSSSSLSSAPSAPISFAAVAAAAARREQERARAPPRPVTPPVQEETVPSYSPVKDTSFEEPETSEPLLIEDILDSEPSVANPPSDPEDEPAVENELTVISDHNVQATSPQLQANAVWTTQLKSELGIGVPIAADVSSPVEPPQQYATPAPIAGVEFATEAVPAVLPDYSFGFVDAPAAPIVSLPAPAPSVEQISQDSLFSTVRHSAVSPLKPSAEITHSNLGNGDFSLRSATPPSAVTPLHQATVRSLGFGDASTVSYTPSGGLDRQPPVTKPLSHLPQQHQAQPSSQHQTQQQQSHQQQPPMFPPQLPYSSFPPYMGMYNPVNSVRPDDYAALMGQYPFGGMNMDLTNFMATSGLAQPSSNQSLSSQHRSDSHGMDSIKFSSQNSREQSQSSAVQPPPGFGGASQFMTQPLNNLVMQQHYPPQHYSFYLPNVTNAGRQMYAQDDERKSYDKMGSGKQAHATPPPQFHHSNTSYLGGGAKKYNWNS